PLPGRVRTPIVRGRALLGGELRARGLHGRPQVATAAREVAVAAVAAAELAARRLVELAHHAVAQLRRELRPEQRAHGGVGKAREGRVNDRGARVVDLAVEVAVQAARAVAAPGLQQLEHPYRARARGRAATQQ